MSREYPAEFKARAVRLVKDRLASDERLSHRAAMFEVGSWLGVSNETVRRWFNDPEVNEEVESESLA